MIAFSRPLPVRYAIAIAAACEPTARTIETISDHSYGLRKPSRRTNVSRYGAVVATVENLASATCLAVCARGRLAAWSSEFPREHAFDEDYLYFYEELLTPERTAGEVDLVWKLLELEPGLELLDLACGHGRIANPLAERGVRVTGLDATPLFLELARADAAERGVEVEYVEGDMRSIPWTERFDRVLYWFTSFGYFGDEENRRVLAEAYRALEPGGLLAVEMNNLLRPHPGVRGRGRHRAWRRQDDRPPSVRRPDEPVTRRAHDHPRREAADLRVLGAHVHARRAAELDARRGVPRGDRIRRRRRAA